VVGSCEHSDEPLGSILENHGFYSMLGFYGLKRLFNVCLVGSHSSSVVGLGWMAGVQFLVGARVGFFFSFFSLALHPDWLWGPPSFCPMATRSLTPVVKWLGHEADHSPPSGVEVKNAWSYTSILPICSYGVLFN